MRTAARVLFIGLLTLLAASANAQNSGSIEQRLRAVEEKAQSAFREGRGLQEDVIRRFVEHDKRLADHERRITSVEIQASTLHQALVEAYQKTERLGQTQARLNTRQGNEEILQGVRNSTAWKFEWSYGKLASSSEKKLAELQHALANGEALVSIVAFCDMKAKSKCDGATQKASVVADRLRVASSFVERQPGREKVTLAFTVHRNK